MWNMNKFNEVLKRLNTLAKKHFSVYGIETLFFNDGDFSMHAYYNEFPIDSLVELKEFKMQHTIHYYKEQDVFGLQIQYDGFNVIKGAVQLEELKE